MSRTVTVVLVMLVGLVSACGSPTSRDPISGAWELESGTLLGRPITMVDGYPITISFDGGTFGGTAACNGYGGEYTTTSGTISLGDISITEMACPSPGVMTSESEYIDALSRIRDFEVKGTLRLIGNDVELNLVALPPVPDAELTGTVWVLESLIDGETVSSVHGERATLELFSDASMLGSTGCRTFHGGYTVAGATVAIATFGADGTCTPDLETQDNQVISVLEGGFRVSIEGDTLTLTTAGNQGLTYRSES